MPRWRPHREQIEWFLLFALIIAGVALHRAHRSLHERPPAAPVSGLEDGNAADDCARPMVAPVLPMEIETRADVRELRRAARTAGPEDVRALAEAALTAQDPLVAAHAVRALGRLGAVAGDPALRLLLHDPRGRVRQEVVRALGLERDRSAVPDLAELLGTADASLRPMVIQALGRIGGPEACLLLTGVLEAPGASEVDRVFARAALHDLR